MLSGSSIAVTIRSFDHRLFARLGDPYRAGRSIAFAIKIYYRAHCSVAWGISIALLIQSLDPHWSRYTSTAAPRSGSRIVVKRSGNADFKSFSVIFTCVFLMPCILRRFQMVRSINNCPIHQTSLAEIKQTNSDQVTELRLHPIRRRSILLRRPHQSTRLCRRSSEWIMSAIEILSWSRFPALEERHVDRMRIRRFTRSGGAQCDI